MGFPGGSNGKESACSAGDLGSSTELGRSPGEGNGNPLQYSCLENPMNREAWWVTVHGVAKSWTRLKWLSTHARHEVTLSLFKNSKQTVLIPFFNNPNYTHLYKIIYIILNYIYIYIHTIIFTHTMTSTLRCLFSFMDYDFAQFHLYIIQSYFKSLCRVL